MAGLLYVQQKFRNVTDRYGMKQYGNFVSKCRIWFTCIKLCMQGTFDLQSHSFCLVLEEDFVDVLAI